MTEEKTFDTGEVAINCAVGVPSGPPALVLHGITGRWQGVQALVSMLEDRWQVFALDLRGHGGSGRAPGQYRLVDFARDVGAFSARLPQPAVVVGHSLGALVAIAAAAEQPDTVRALVLVDPPIYGEELPTISQAEQHKPEFFGQLRWLYDTLQASPSPDDIAARLLEVNPQADPAALAGWADQLSHLDPAVLDSVLGNRMFVGADLVGLLRRVKCPLLLLYGDWDQGSHIREESAAFVGSHVPSAVVVKVTGGSHMFFAEQPDLVRQHLDAFLASV